MGSPQSESHYDVQAGPLVSPRTLDRADAVKIGQRRRRRRLRKVRMGRQIWYKSNETFGFMKVIFLLSISPPFQI